MAAVPGAFQETPGDTGIYLPPSAAAVETGAVCGPVNP